MLRCGMTGMRGVCCVLCVPCVDGGGGDGVHDGMSPGAEVRARHRHRGTIQRQPTATLSPILACLGFCLYRHCEIIVDVVHASRGMSNA